MCESSSALLHRSKPRSRNSRPATLKMRSRFSAARSLLTLILSPGTKKALVRISAQLVSGKDGGHLWADRYDNDLTDIFAIQDEITHEIVTQLTFKLLPGERDRAREWVPAPRRAPAEPVAAPGVGAYRPMPSC
jgi:hypothetical protein